MNDTFDDFTIADLQNNISISPITSQLNSTKISTAGQNELTEHKCETDTSSLIVKSEVSFDDSFFINSPCFTSLKITNKSFKENTSSQQLSQNLFDISINLKRSSADKNIHKLSSWGLPTSILEKYAQHNITSMFSWQVECLNNAQVLEKNKNLIYSAPTSAGKTLVAEILSIKTVLEREKKVIIILPFVSVVREKMFHFQDIFSKSGVRVEGFMGSYNPPGGFQSVQVAICTIEKANNLINKLLQEDKLAEVGAVVIDEMHLLGDPSRGYLLELLLTKLKYVSLRNDKVKIQIIGMSATLPNLEILAKWLEAELYVTTYRPIPLHEQAHICGDIYDNELKVIRRLKTLPELDTDTDNILQLCLETIRECCSVLIFCPTKNWCENLALQISTAFWKLGNSKNEYSQQLREQLKSELILELLEQLKFSPVGLDEVLRKTVSFGVAFHHAGLTLDERDIIEGAFRRGAIRVLVATSTLSSGVNLPAKRVIIRTPLFHGKPLDALTYKQMVGRAGRMGRDTSGESILVCQKNQLSVAKSLMNEQLQPIESCLEGEGKLKRAILEVIASGVASSPADVELFTKCTLLSAQTETFDDPIEEAVKFLVANEFVRLQEHDNKLQYVASNLGKACLSSSIPPEDGLALFTELEKARQCFVLENELHLIYLVTPYSACHQWGNIDWMFYLNVWERLPSSMKKVGELVGVRESYIANATRGRLQTNTGKLYHKLLVHKRFFVALALQDLVNEIPLPEVCAKYSCNRGMLQSLQLSASTFAGMVTSFSKQLGWSNVEILISQFQDRLHFGVSRDLLDLMRLPILNGKSARALYNGGLENLIQLANSDIATIENILHKVMPFESGKKRDGETEFDLIERNKLRNIWITGKQGLTEREAAELLLISARDFLKTEMGLKEAKWDSVRKAEPEQDSGLRNSISSIDLNFKDSRKSSYLLSDGSLFEDSVTDEVKSNHDAFLTSYGSLNSSGDLIATSQDENCMSGKTPSSSRKRSRKSGTPIFFEQTPRKKLKFANITQTPQKSSLDINEMEIVDVCRSEKLYSTFCKEVSLEKCISLSVACVRVEEKKPIIGLTDRNTIFSNLNQFTYKNRQVQGFAIFWGGNTVYYLNLNKMAKCVQVVRVLVGNEDVTIRLFDCKEQIKVLKNCCNIEFRANVEEPKIGDWILEPEGEEKNLTAMALAYCPDLLSVLNMCGGSKDNQNDVRPDLKSSAESLVTWYVTAAIKQKLNNQFPNLSMFYDIEMNNLRTLAKMEAFGLGVRKQALDELVDTINKEKTAIESKAFNLAGRRFSFTSTKDVAKVLGLRPGKKISTRKEILEKNENPISDLVLDWRKLNCIITKTIQPLIRCVENDRIHGRCVVHTATGRITMHEPNLQNVAKNFEIKSTTNGKKTVISCRNAFVPTRGCTFVSADYCQLELRLLAHLSRDGLLRKIMTSEGDIFRSIAAKWNKIEEKQVTDDLRQHTKKICYGIIYGIGSKSLSEQLCTDEDKALMLMESFKKAYPGVTNYITGVINSCRENGYVETIVGRRRYLPHINHQNLAIRSQAERQAVNTTIQGSAADIVKNAMIKLDKKCSELREPPNLVLHLHDELLYEVPENSLCSFATLLKGTMEKAFKLSVPLPVKLKSGPSWGQLTEYQM